MVATSSAEAEFYAAARGTSMCLGLQRLLLDQGLAVSLPPSVKTDATASQALAARRGAGRIKHLAVAAVWLQIGVARKGVRLERVAGADNPADLGTKPLTRPRMTALLENMGYGYRTGRHDRALGVQTGAATTTSSAA